MSMLMIRVTILKILLCFLQEILRVFANFCKDDTLFPGVVVVVALQNQHLFYCFA